MKIQIIQWNIKINSNPKMILAYIKEKMEYYSIINLQEVSRNNYEILKNELKLDCSYSLDLRVPGKYEGRNRQMGVMTMINNGSIINTHLIEKSVFPERTLVTSLKLSNLILTNLTFHSLTGVDYKKAKSSNFASIASYFPENKIDIMTCDANEPNIESVNEDEIIFFDNRDKGKMACLLFGKDKIHDLVDTYKYFTLAESRILLNGYTHIVGGNKKRYDYIYCKNNWKVISSEVTYEASIKASSDHGMVETILDIKEDG
jgi:hypothetical protein